MNLLNRKKGRGIGIGVVALLMILLAACQPAVQQQSTPTLLPTSTTAPTPTMAPTATAAEEIPQTGTEDQVTINVASHPELGDILVDGQGMSLYMFTKDEPNKSNCSGGCLEAWPPLIAGGDVQAGEGVDQSLIGEGDLGDGRKIVTYNGMPLYYWKGDVKPGDATGQDVNQVWYVVSPDGQPIGMPEGSTNTGDTQAGSEVVLQVAEDPNLGPYLVDGKGMALYMFTKDEPNKSNCSGGCLEAWPPLVAEGDIQAGDQVDESLIGSTDLPDGKKIVTYNGMPLYYWQNDKNPGDVTGQGVNEVWYVVSPDGNPVMGQ